MSGLDDNGNRVTTPVTTPSGQQVSPRQPPDHRDRLVLSKQSSREAAVAAAACDSPPADVIVLGRCAPPALQARPADRGGRTPDDSTTQPRHAEEQLEEWQEAGREEKEGEPEERGSEGRDSPGSEQGGSRDSSSPGATQEEEGEVTEDSGKCLQSGVTSGWGSYDGLSNGVTVDSPQPHHPGPNAYTRWDSQRCSIEFHFPTASNAQEAEMEVDAGSVLAFAGGRPRAQSATYRRGCQARRRRHFRPDCGGMASTWSVLPAWLATGLVLTAALGHLLSFSLPLWAQGRGAGRGTPGVGGRRGECAGLRADHGGLRATYGPTLGPPLPEYYTALPPPVIQTAPSTPADTTTVNNDLNDQEDTQVGSSSTDNVTGAVSSSPGLLQTDLANLTTSYYLSPNVTGSDSAQTANTTTTTATTGTTAATTDSMLKVAGQTTQHDPTLTEQGGPDPLEWGNRTQRLGVPAPLTQTVGVVVSPPGQGARWSVRPDTGEYVTIGMWNICREDTCWMWCMDRLPGWFRLVQAFTTLGLVFCLMTSSLAVCQIAMPHCKDKYLATGGAAVILLLGESFMTVAVAVFGARVAADRSLAGVGLHVSWSFYIAVLSAVTGMLAVLFLFWDTRIAQLDKTAYFDIDQEDAEEEALRLS